MRLVYIDLEPKGAKPVYANGLTHGAALELKKQRLISIGAYHVEIRNFSDFRIDEIELSKTILVLGGRGSPWTKTDDRQAEELRSFVRSPTCPVLGICMGMIFIGWAHNARSGLIGDLRKGEEDPFPDYYPGVRKEIGYGKVFVEPHKSRYISECTKNRVFYQWHFGELKTVPPGFHACARSEVCPIQMIEHGHLPIVGVQFHPENFDEEHSDGRHFLTELLRHLLP